ncbi:hypothetical protein [Agrococcus baldri]|uniref:Uncharacterized protein n=1 Tax=Agrococcus baldri TaxID=153730 RepID=A0AA87UYK0_9MICO|nr:hypothetical protein [Agrococcus baldri]GEK81332.1 hypothetical protein ABA31_26830 [Agrococcus baldri]
MNDERMPRGPGMDDAFKARMRQGLSTMAVRERMRERARTRAIAGGALAAVVVATAAVFGIQALGGDAERDQAAPPTPTATETTPPEGFEPPPASEAPEPMQTGQPGPTPPPGFEGVAAGEPQVLDAYDCGAADTECGDAGAAGGPQIERYFDAYVLCRGSGSVLYGESVWIDCTEHEPGTGWAQLRVPDVVGDGDPQFTATGDFDGELATVDAGRAPAGGTGAERVTAYLDCNGFGRERVTVGGTVFDCGQGGDLVVEQFGAWGVPVAPGSFAPAITVEGGEAPVIVRWLEER